MARLPGYDSSRQLSTQSPTALKDKDVASQQGQNVTKLGKVASEISKVWQEAQDTATILKNKNAMAEELYKLNKLAIEDPDPNNIQTYYDELQRIKDTSSVGFTNNLARAKYDTYASNELMNARINIDSQFRDKMFKDAQGQAIESERINYGIYKDSKNEYQAALSIKAHEQNLQDLLDKGLINRVFFENQITSLATWPGKRQDIQIRDAIVDNPAQVEADILGGKYDQLDGEERLVYLNLAKQRKAYLETASEILVEETQLKNVALILDDWEKFSASDILELTESKQLSVEDGAAFFYMKTDSEYLRKQKLDPKKWKVEKSYKTVADLAERIVEPGQDLKEIRAIISKAIVSEELEPGQAKLFYDTVKDIYKESGALYIKRSQGIEIKKSWTEQMDIFFSNTFSNKDKALKAFSDWAVGFYEKISKGMSVAEAAELSKAEVLSAGIPSINGIGDKGELRVDPNGVKAIVYKDGTYKVVN